MPRKKPEQPKPEKEFWITTEDGERIPVAIYKDGEWEIERGWNTKVKSIARVSAHVDRAVTHILRHNALPDWLKSTYRFAAECLRQGWDGGGKDNDDTNLRKDVYPKVVKELRILLTASGDYPHLVAELPPPKTPAR